MSKIAALRDERKTKIEELEAALLAEGEAFDADNADMLDKEISALEMRIEKMEELEKRKATLAEPQRTFSAPRVVAPEAAREFSSIDEMVEAVIATADGVVDQRLSDLWNPGRIRGEQSFGVGAKGGFMIPTQFLPEVMRVDPAATPLLNFVRKIAAGSQPDARIEMPALDQTGASPDNQFGGVTVDWIGEGVTKPETDADLRKVALQPKEVAGHIKITDMLRDNWSGAGSFYGALLGQALNWAKESALWNGNGVARPAGILNQPARIDVNRNNAGTVDYDDVSRMKAAQIYRGGTKFWLVNQGLMPALDQMANVNGNLIFKRDSIAEGSPATLEGYPVYWYENASAVGARGDISLLQVDPYYIVKQGTGPMLAMGLTNDDFVRNKHTIKIFERIDGNGWLTAPYELANGLNVSPFVFLDVP